MDSVVPLVLVREPGRVGAEATSSDDLADARMRVKKVEKTWARGCPSVVSDKFKDRLAGSGVSNM